MLVALAVAIVIAQASPQASATAPAKAVEPATAKPAKPEKPKLICHDETATGSIISQRVCRTPEQVAAEQAQSQREHNALSDHLAACHGAPSC
jgi:hypothetical protein